MAQKSAWWTTGSTGDGASEYTQAEVLRIWRQQWLGDDATEGVKKNYENELAVSGVATPIAINPGAALVYGLPYWNTASVNEAVATPAASTRVDRLILRATWATQVVRIILKPGTEGLGAPALTQTDGVVW